MQTFFTPDLPVFIIGGGPSLHGFDWNKLKRKQCLVVNLGYRKVKWADAMFFGDNGFFDTRKDPAGEHFWQFGQGKIFTSASHCGGMKGRIEYIRPSILTEGFCDGLVDPAKLNSGAQAILLAHQLGAKEIVLLGFDGKPGHWASQEIYGYRSLPDPSVFPGYGEQLERLATLGLNIVNANPASAVDCFPKVDPNIYF